MRSNHLVLVRDITSVEGVRENMLVGYGLVGGIAPEPATRQQTIFTVQTINGQRDAEDGSADHSEYGSG